MMTTVKTILIVEDEPMTRKLLQHILGKTYNIIVCDSAKKGLEYLKSNSTIDCVLSDLYMPEIDGKEFVRQIRQNVLWAKIPVIILSGAQESDIRINCLEIGADDFITKPFNPKEVQLKIAAILRRNHYVGNHKKDNTTSVNPTPLLHKNMPWWKRVLDIIVSGAALFLLAPLFLIVSVLIKLDSKGAVIYKSKRAGAKYQIFDLYKFRTMRTDADRLLSQMEDLNMYNQTKSTSEDNLGLCCSCGGNCRSKLVKEGMMICEKNYLQTIGKDAAFKKFQNDPRVTQLGSFLRNSSLDELPQLWNIFIGDMSLVGNRPLPLYEAEKLTTDAAIGRFDAPAGLTGLWQVTKRGKSKKDMSAEERIELDIEYAKRVSPKLDLRIIAKTIPALLQSENV